MTTAEFCPNGASRLGRDGCREVFLARRSRNKVLIDVKNAYAAGRTNEMLLLLGCCRRSVAAPAILCGSIYCLIRGCACAGGGLSCLNPDDVAAAALLFRDEECQDVRVRKLFEALRFARFAIHIRSLCRSTKYLPFSRARRQMAHTDTPAFCALSCHAHFPIRYFPS